jgi:hypothetical protein
MGFDTTFPYTYLWDTRRWADGQQHIIKAIAWDNAGNYQSHSITVTVELFVPPSPIIVLKNLDYTPHDNYFETVFEVHNAGTADATNVTIKICHRGFQCVSETDVRSPNNVVYDVEASYSVEDYTSCATITYDGTLGPGANDTITVNIVPILYPSHPSYNNPFPYCIGSHYELDYAGAPTPTSIVANFHQGGNLAIYEIPVDSAVKSADYLIVTNPENLFLFNNIEADVDNLLSAMAELAMLKYGVLGYFYAPASLKANIGRLDLMACGDVDGDGREDIIVARDANGEVYIYGMSDTDNGIGYKASVQTSYEGPGSWMGEELLEGLTFDYGDGLACGDIDGDGRAEIIVAENTGPEAGRIEIYGYNPTTKAYGLERFYNTSFDNGDGLVCGNVDQDVYAEIIVAEDNDNDGTEGAVEIYDIFSTSTPPEYSVSTSFEGSNLQPSGASHGADGLTCGDVDEDGVAEIIVTDPQNGDVHVYNTTGLEFSITSMSPYGYDARLEPWYAFGVAYTYPYNHDGLACGDVDGQGAAEIIVAEDMFPPGRVDIWSSGTLSAGNVMTTSFGIYDHLACGDVDGDGQEEIIIGDNEWDWIDVITYGRSHAGQRDRLRDLIEKGGVWSSRLRDGWTSEGYLLIVGETEIIPAGMSTHDLGALEASFREWPGKVRCTDIYYASTNGDWVPELNIGRIIGNTANNLTIPIKTSIEVCQNSTGYGFDRSDALVVAGRGPGVRDYEDGANDMEKILRNGSFDVVKLKQRKIENAGGNIRTAFKAGVTDKDVIFYTGHGGEESWGHTTSVIEKNDFSGSNPIDFGETNPFVFGCCCLTGRYAGITGIAETFLNNGAAAYIGATEVSYGPWESWAAEEFFERWLSTGETIGLTFKKLKRDLANGCYGSIHDLAKEINKPLFRFWSSEYTLYGDPKYGGSCVSNCAGLIALAETEIQGPLSSLDVIVPNYEVTTVEGEDYAYVEIPDGDMLLVPDKPMVPFYTVSLNYPQGYEVQDVILTDISGLTTTTGLNIRNVVLEE